MTISYDPPSGLIIKISIEGLDSSTSPEYVYELVQTFLGDKFRPHVEYVDADLLLDTATAEIILVAVGDHESNPLLKFLREGKKF